MTHTKRIVPVLAGVAAAATLAPRANADLAELYVSANAWNQTSITYEGDSQSIADTEAVAQFFSQDTGFDFNWSATAGEPVDHNGQSAFSKSSHVLNTDSTGFAYQSTVEFGSDLGQAGYRSRGSAYMSFQSAMTFDSDTEIEVLFRIDFTPSNATYHYAEIEIIGLENPATRRMVINGSSAEGSVTSSYHAMALAGSYIELQTRIEGEADTDFGSALQYSGEFTVTTIVRAVPAPSSAGLLILGVLLPARRRRHPN